MNRMNKWTISVLLILCITHAWSQQEWGYGQFAMNLFDSNIAYAGQHETPSFAIRHRQQWMGIEGGPKSSFVSVHMPLSENRMGIGMRLLTETIGARQQSFLHVAWAYRLRLPGGTLNFALAGGASRNGIDWGRVQVWDVDDPQISQWENARWAPVVNAALFFSRKNFYIGTEWGQLTRSYYGETSFAQKMHLKSVLGYHKKVRKDDQLQMASLFKWSEAGEWQMECNVTYLKNNRVGLGAGYRWNYGAIILAQIHFSDQFRVGLNYDLAAQATQRTYEGSLEVFLGYTLNKGSAKSIRYL